MIVLLESMQPFRLIFEPNRVALLGHNLIHCLLWDHLKHRWKLAWLRSVVDDDDDDIFVNCNWVVTRWQ